MNWNWLELLPSLLSTFGLNKPEIEKPLKAVIDVVVKLPVEELKKDIPLIDVKAAQEALTEAGFDPGPIDGFAGPRTQEAVRQYQEANGLFADGILGQLTWKSLMA